MKNFLVSQTKTTPLVDFNYENGVLKIEGESYPENSIDFYKPVFHALNEYIASKPEFTFIFKMVYFNTSSSKAIMDLIDILDDYHSDGGKVNMEWHFESGDEDIEETGLEFTEDLDIPTKLVEYE